MSALELIREIEKTQTKITEFKQEFKDKTPSDIDYYLKRLNEVNLSITDCLTKIREQLKSQC